MATNRRGSFQDLNAFFVFGACTIVVIHIIGFFLQSIEQYPGSYEWEALSLILLRFGRSLFIFCTGMLLFYWYKHRQMDWGTFWRKRWHNIMVPYIGWTGIYTFITYKTFAPAVFVPAFLDSLVTGSSFYHLYYIPLFLQLNLLFMLTKHLLERHLHLPLLLGAFLLQTLLYEGFVRMPQLSFMQGINEASPLLLQIVKHGYVYAQNYPYMYLFYFTLGAFAGLHVDKWRAATRRYWSLSLVICTATALYLSAAFLKGWLSYGEALNIFSPLYLVYTATFILLCYPLSARLGKSPSLGPWLSRLARHNLAIYLVHPLILYLLESYVISRLGLSTPALMVIMFAITLPLSILLFTHRLPLLGSRKAGKKQPVFRMFQT